jgi:peptidoglycan/xylan/chitin deacetylase (PgdA/CDA1 family)
MKPPKEYLKRTMLRMILRVLPALIVVLLWINGQHAAAIAVFGTAFCIIAYVTLSPTTRLLGPVTITLPDEGVLLTLDDGPHPDTTPALLDLLDRHQAKAVFFVIGDRVKQWPQLAREIVRRGHTLGNHSQTHPSASFWALGPWRTWAQIADGQETIRAATGVTPTWFRAPVGHYNMFTHPALHVLGLRLMAWSARGFDTVEKDVSRVLRRLEPDLKPGAIVLLHEAIPHSVALVEAFLQRLQERGLRLATPAQR